MFQSNVNVGQCLSVSECLLENAASVILPGGIPALGPNVGVTEGERVLGRGQGEAFTENTSKILEKIMASVTVRLHQT